MPANELGFFQKHTEKIALALGVTVLAGAGATQFLLGEPNAVTIDGKQVGPGEIADQVRQQVDRLETKLNVGESPIETFESPAYTENFVKLYKRQVAGGKLPGLIGSGGLDGSLAVVDSPDYPTKVLPTPPVATDMVIKVGNGVLAEAAGGRERGQIESLRQIIGDQRPADFPYVSVRGTFPIATYRERYETAGGTDAERINEGLWGRRMMLAGVYLVRSRWDRTAESWGPLKVIRPLPGHFSALPEDRPQLSREEADGLEKELVTRQEDIRRAAFPRLTNGPWTPPDANNRVFSAEELELKDTLEGRLANFKRQLERLVAPEPSRNGRRTGRDRNTRGRGGAGFEDQYGGDFGDGGYGEGGFDDGGGAARRGGRSRSGSSSRAQREQEQAQRRIETLRTKIQETQTELNNLLGVDEQGLADFGGAGAYGDNPFGAGGFDEDPYGAGGYGADPYGAGSYGADPYAASGATPVADGLEELRVWAHDLTCKPGETYRYKLVVSMFNPLYRQTRLTRQQLKENYDRIAIGPDESELNAAPWSTPVNLAPKFFYFATSGNKDEKRAEFEVWTIHNGVWETAEFPEVPGNEIGGLATTAAPGGVPMAVGKILLDVDAVTSSVAGGSTQIRTLVLDQASGEIEGRLVSDDRRSAQRDQLVAEREAQIRRRDGVGGPTASIDGR